MLGYLDEAWKVFDGDFDLVFNNLCYYYCWNDADFARVLFALVRPGGSAYIDTTHSKWRRETLSFSARLRTLMNERLGVKVGHPYPPRGRLAALFAEMPIEKMIVDYRSPDNDRILFKRDK